MLEQRKDRLLKKIEEARKISLAALSKAFKVSELTIRRDLKPLEESQRVKVGKGEVVFIPRDSKRIELEPCEETVAEMAASVVGEKDRIIWLGGGRISLGIAGRIRDVTIVTNSLLIATAALQRKGIKVFLVGEEVDPETSCLFGKSLEMIRKFTFSKAFLEAGGYFNRRFLVSSLTAETASLLSGNVLEKFIVIRGDNFGNVGTARLGGLKEFKAVYTDSLKLATLREIEGIPLRVIGKKLEADPYRVIPLKTRP